MQSFEHIITTGMISIMSFFGWNFEEYKHVLPDVIERIGVKLEKIAEKIEIPNASSTETSVKKILETKPVPKPAKIEPTKPMQITPPCCKPAVKPVIPEPKPIVVPPPAKPVIVPPVTVTPPPVVTPPIIQANLTTDQKIKASIGNIFCSIIEAGRVRKITGSAVAISNNGVMLTNAHVAEYILLENTKAMNNISCFIRTGSPAARAYKASVVYLPPQWVDANKDNLRYSALSGTGENDYALIVLNEKVVGSTAPNLSFIEGDTREISVGTGVTLAGYPAFGGNIIDNALYAVLEKSQVNEVWRLNRTDSDLMGSAPTILAVNGSSGGAAATSAGKLAGIMVATTADSRSGKPNMRLISYGYISKDIESKTGSSITSLIRNADSESAEFITGIGVGLAQTLVSNSR